MHFPTDRDRALCCCVPCGSGAVSPLSLAPAVPPGCVGAMGSACAGGGAGTAGSHLVWKQMLEMIGLMRHA